MRKFSKARQQGARRNQLSRWEGLSKILSLCTRVEHTKNVAPVIDGFEAVDMLAYIKGL